MNGRDLHTCRPFGWQPALRRHPGFLKVVGMCDLASLCATVTSHVSDLSACHGVSLRPSGLLLSSLLSPTGSFLAGILALVIAR